MSPLCLDAWLYQTSNLLLEKGMIMIVVSALIYLFSVTGLLLLMKARTLTDSAYALRVADEEQMYQLSKRRERR
jgi:hypothetical protein